MVPTVGRVVYFYDVVDGNVQPCTAHVTAVHTDECLNLVVFPPNPGMFFKTSVMHTSFDMETVETLDDKASMVGKWGWMPYQKAQAKKEK
jgi:hypothetical protein